VPLYVLENYPHHLAAAADDPEAMELLLSEGWQRAWFEQDGGYARYSADIAALMDAFRKVLNLDAGTRLAMRVRCGLILSSIRSIGVNTPSQLLAALVRHGKMSSRQALHRLQFQNPDSLANGLPLAFDVADPVTKIAILTVAEGIRDDRAKVGALGSLADRLPDNVAQSFIFWVPDHVARMQRKTALRLLAQLTMCFDFPVALSISKTILETCNRWK
jgi:hypothetical protein